MLKFSLCHLGIRPERSQIYRNSLVVKNPIDIIIKPKKITQIDTNIIFKHDKTYYIECILNNTLVEKSLELESSHIFIIEGRSLKINVINTTKKDIRINKDDILCELILVNSKTNQLSLLSGELLNIDSLSSPKKESVSKKVEKTSNVKSEMKNASLMNKKVAVESIPPPITDLKKIQKTIKRRIINSKPEAQPEPVVEEVAPVETQAEETQPELIVEEVAPVETQAEAQPELIVEEVAPVEAQPEPVAEEVAPVEAQPEPVAEVKKPRKRTTKKRIV